MCLKTYIKIVVLCMIISLPDLISAKGHKCNYAVMAVENDPNQRCKSSPIVSSFIRAALIVSALLVCRTKDTSAMSGPDGYKQYTCVANSCQLEGKHAQIHLTAPLCIHT